MTVYIVDQRVDRKRQTVAEIPAEIVESSGYIAALAPFLPKRERRCLERGLVIQHDHGVWVVPHDSKGNPLAVYYFSKYAE